MKTPGSRYRNRVASPNIGYCRRYIGCRKKRWFGSRFPANVTERTFSSEVLTGPKPVHSQGRYRSHSSENGRFRTDWIPRIPCLFGFIGHCWVLVYGLFYNTAETLIIQSLIQPGVIVKVPSLGHSAQSTFQHAQKRTDNR